MTFLQAHRFGLSQITRPPPITPPHGSSRLTSLTLRPLMSAQSLDATAQWPRLTPPTQAAMTETLITPEAQDVHGGGGGWGGLWGGACVYTAPAETSGPR